MGHFLPRAHSGSPPSWYAVLEMVRNSQCSIVIQFYRCGLEEGNVMGYLESGYEPTPALLTVFPLRFLSLGSGCFCGLLPPLAGFFGLPWSEARTPMLSYAAVRLGDLSRLDAGGKALGSDGCARGCHDTQGCVCHQ